MKELFGQPMPRRQRRHPRPLVRSRSCLPLRRLVASLFVASIGLLLLSCDSRKDTLREPLATLLCESSAQCESGRSTRFAMLGDSWTDLGAGQPLIRDLRDVLQEDYGFGITGSTLAGQQLATVLTGGLHLETIRRSGPGLRFVLVSLGGNDLTFSASSFVADPNLERARVLGSIEGDLRRLVHSGNAYKRELYGGPDLVWFLHGYDYSNPDNVFDGVLRLDQGCRARLNAAGYPDAVIDAELPRNLDAYAAMLARVANAEPSVRRIDLRGVLGGPPVSNRALMFDCIHPNSAGFVALAGAFVPVVDAVTGGAR